MTSPMATTESNMPWEVGLKPESEIFLASVSNPIVERVPPLLSCVSLVKIISPLCARIESQVVAGGNIERRRG